MFTTINHKGKNYKTDLSQPMDISIPLRAGVDNVNAWYVPPVTMEPVRNADFIGAVSEGGSVNFRNIFFNPHGNGTHTECVGHISKEFYSINQCLKNYFFIAQVVTILPDELENGDQIITKKHIENCLDGNHPEAIIIRTLSNPISKINFQYSNSNPPFLHHEAAKYIVDSGIQHLLIDLPSVDKERDDGKLLAHHTFWEYPQNTQKHRTITELIYVPNTILDGEYFLNLQIASFENDASPSKPVLFRLVK
ncbi:MAG: cyclase family protein [Bacteroidia bacterium]